MRIHHLSLEHFRGFTQLSLFFPKEYQTFCFVGPNTIGKTNILESMYFLTLLKSFRTNEPRELLQWDQSHIQIAGQFQIEQDTLDLQVNALFTPRAQKKMRINNIVTSLQDYVGRVNMVFFSPDDINLLLLSPQNRRKYMDILLSQTDRSYLTALVHFQKALRQRNALLKTIIQTDKKPTEELSIWNYELARWIVPIMHKRAHCLEHLSIQAARQYSKIADYDRALLEIRYHPSGKQYMLQESDVIRILEERFQRDCGEECTTFGPHRDDFYFYVDNKAIDTFASRGDTRSIILALKLAEISYIESIHGQHPILLLDDVFSELDSARQQQFIETLPKHIQTIITTTNKEGNALKKGNNDSVYFFTMEDMLYS